MSRFESWPHGLCECRQGCRCQHGPGPAVFVIERAGKEMRVCTRCYFSTDTEKRILVTGEDATDPLYSWDPLGHFCVIGRLAKLQDADAVGEVSS